MVRRTERETEGVEGNLPAAAAAACSAAWEAAVLYNDGDQRVGRDNVISQKGAQKTHRLATLRQRRRRTQRPPETRQPARRQPAKRQPARQRRQQLQVGGTVQSSVSAVEVGADRA